MEPSDIRTRLAGGERFLLDGAVGTELDRIGAKGRPGIAGAPEVIRQIHESYLEAGADLLTTDTFTTNRYGLRKCGYTEDRITEFTRQAAELACDTRDRLNPNALIVGSMSGPGFENIEQEYADQAEALVAGGVDVRHVTEKGMLDTGHTIQDVIDSFGGNRPDAILLMCSSPEAISASLPVLRQAFDGSIGAYANILDRWNELTPERYAEFGREWVRDHGAQIVGGCCGTRPEHIAALRTVLDEAATS